MGSKYTIPSKKEKKKKQHGQEKLTDLSLSFINTSILYTIKFIYDFIKI